MAKAKTPNPTIVVDGISREMTTEEFDAYKLANQEVQADISARLKAKQDKEVIVAKLAVIGISEDDLKGLGL